MSDELADRKVKTEGKETRLKTKRVEKMLMRYSSLPMQEQKEKIEKRLKELQGDFEQRDDITVLGVKL